MADSVAPGDLVATIRPTVELVAHENAGLHLRRGVAREFGQLDVLRGNGPDRCHPQILKRRRELVGDEFEEQVDLLEDRVLGPDGLTTRVPACPDLCRRDRGDRQSGSGDSSTYGACITCPSKSRDTPYEIEQPTKRGQSIGEAAA